MLSSFAASACRAPYPVSRAELPRHGGGNLLLSRSVMRPIKTCAVTALLSALVLPTHADAELRPSVPTPRAASARRNSVNADVGLAVLGLAYQRVVHPRVELQVQAQYFSPWFVSSGVGGFGAQLRPFFFLSGAAPAGVYISPFVRASYVRGRINDVEGGGLGLSAGATFGQSFFFARRVVLRGGVGLQYLSYEVASPLAKARIQTFYPTIDLSIGIAF